MQRTITRRWTAIAATGALLALGVTACGNSGDSSQAANTASKAAPSNVHFTGAPITVMTQSTYGNAETDQKDPITVAQAAAAQINAHGGIDGHQLIVLGCNDGTDANAAAACAREAVAHHVVAEVGGTSNNPQVVMPILEQAGIPWLSSVAVSVQDATSKYSFPLVAGGFGFTGTAVKAVQDGCSSIGIVHYDIPVVAAIVPALNAVLAKMHAKPAVDIPVPPTATTFDSIAAEVAKVQCAVSLVPAQSFLGVVAATRQAGAKTTFYAVPSTFNAQILKQGGASLDGTVTSSSFPVPSSPLWNAAKAATPSSIDWTAIYTDSTWAGYQVLADVLKKVKTPQITAHTVYQALSTDAHVTTGGLTPTLNFTKELPVKGLNRIFNPTAVFSKVSNGQLVPDGQPINLAAGMS